LWWFLQRRGMPANLRLGVRKSGTSLEAHACVELYGVVLHDDIYQDFFPFDQDIATAAAHRAHR